MCNNIGWPNSKTMTGECGISFGNCSTRNIIIVNTNTIINYDVPSFATFYSAKDLEIGRMMKKLQN